jgi:hypothetical protein
LIIDDAAAGDACSVGSCPSKLDTMPFNLDDV